jgi:glucose-1-phosphate adenylyltransferase
MKDVLTLILGGGRGTRLYPLTKHRSEPAVPIAGKYRLIDIPISNCINSGLQRIFVLTQYLSVSLHRHIANTYKFDPFGSCSVEVLAAQQTNEAADWYRGTADAIRQNIRYVHTDPGSDVLLLSGDQLYRMDFRDMLATHRESRADVTVAVVPVTQEQAANFGVVRLDEGQRVVGLVEKPRTASELAGLQTPPGFLPRHGRPAVAGRDFLANMGIYLFRREVLIGLLNGQPRAHDLWTQLVAGSLGTHRVQAHLYDGYWEDVGSVGSYHRASLALASDAPPFDFHSPEGIIYTRMRYLPAARVRASHLQQCVISDGCVVQAGTRLERCVVGVRSRIGRDVTLRDTVMIGADDFESDAQRAEQLRQGVPALGVGDGCVIERAILDKDCRIGHRVQLVNRRGLDSDEGANYVIRDGIVVIPNGAVVPDGTVI